MNPRAVTLLCLLTVAVTSPLAAQDTEQGTTAAAPAEGSTTTEEMAEAERAADRADNVRDLINDNLVESPDDDRIELEVPEVEAPPTAEPAPETAPAEVAEPLWYERFQSVPEFLQGLTDYPALLAGREWIHFGRIELEYGHFTGGLLSDESGFNFRSLRGGLIRRYNEKVTVKLELDLTDGDSNWADLWLRYRLGQGVFTIGNQRVAQTLINQTSRLSRTFQEVALPADAFGLGRRLGVGWDLHRANAGVHVTAFGEDLNEHIGDFGYGLRGYYNPANSRFTMIHLGVSAVRESMEQDARFRAYPESRVTDIRLVDTGRNPEVDQQTIYGVELAAARRSTSFRSEYFRAEWDRPGLPDADFYGYYLQANWAITGESFQYSQGKFLRIRPKGVYGAWEVALRYSAVNLNSGDIRGGAQRNASVALNWYSPGRYFRIQGALIRYQTDVTAGDQDDYIAQLRGQFNF